MCAYVTLLNTSHINGKQLRKLDVVTKQQMSVHHVQKAVNDTSGERILLNISLSNQLHLSSVIHPTAVSAGFVPDLFIYFFLNHFSWTYNYGF